MVSLILFTHLLAMPDSLRGMLEVNGCWSDLCILPRRYYDGSIRAGNRVEVHDARSAAEALEDLS